MQEPALQHMKHRAIISIVSKQKPSTTPTFSTGNQHVRSFRARQRLRSLLLFIIFLLILAALYFLYVSIKNESMMH